MTDDPIQGDAEAGDDQRVVTALVVVRPASPAERRADTHRAPQGPAPADEPPSRANLDRLVPSDHDLHVVAEGFGQLGFSVGPPLGNSLAITAPRRQMEAAFGVQLVEAAGCWSVMGAIEAESELPTTRLGPELSTPIERIVLEPPVELHEEGFFP